jgi:hypothetical protein
MDAGWILNIVFSFISVLMFRGISCFSQGELALNEQILQACKELIDDAKMGCVDLVFKEVCLEILSRARNVLTQHQFKQLAAYASLKMKEKVSFEVRNELTMQR